MWHLAQDLRFSLRTYVRRPGFALAALSTIAFGMAANATIFSAVHAVLLRPLPYPAPERLVWMEERASNLSGMSVAYPNFLDYREQARSFQRLAAFRWRGLDLMGHGDPERVEGYEVSSGFFETLGVRPALGRTLGEADDQPGAAPTAVLSHALWRRRFGGDPAIIGRALRLDGRDHVVIGVAPRGFRFPDPAQLWIPLGLVAPSLASRDDHAGLSLVGRLAHGVSLAAARTELESISGRLARAYPTSNQGVGVSATPLTDQIVGDTRPMLLALLGAVGLVLLIACVNVSNLLLVHTVTRRREIAVRAALGAGRARVLRQLLTESLLLSAAGGVAGAVLAVWLVGGLRTVVSSVAFVPRLDEIAVDGPVLAFTAVLTAVVAALCGLLPSLQASKLELGAALTGSRSTPSASRLHRLLVVGETALAVVVLAGGGLLVRSFVKLMHVDPGFSPAEVLALDLSLSPGRDSGDGAPVARYDQLLETLWSQPAVRSAALGAPLPFSGASSQARALPEGVPFAKENTVLTDFVTVSPRYFETIGIPLVRGRDFGDGDTDASPLVVVVSEATARRFWPGQDPIGKRMCFEVEFPADGPPLPTWREVVGVVGHVKHYGLSQESRQQIYVSHRQMPLYSRGQLPAMTVVVRAPGGGAAGATLVRSALRALGEGVPVHNVRTLESALAGSVSRNRISAWLMSMFAGAALLLAVVGIFGLVSYAVSQRTAEIGVRMALGAGRREVWRLFVGEGMKPVLVGTALGLAGAVALTRALAGLLFEVSPTDPATFGAVAVLLATVALIACWLPARRAVRVDPVAALRAE
jgi:putative ABC transport system permease protein